MTALWLAWKQHSIIYQEETRENSLGLGRRKRDEVPRMAHLAFEVSVTVG